jgi:Tfp pilus assembly PilM family ATPase
LKALGVDLSESFLCWVQIEGNQKSFKVQDIGFEIRSPEKKLKEGNEKEGNKEQQLLPKANRVYLATPSRFCILREISIPFKGRDEIKKTLKYEAESYFQSYSIEDLLVDAVVLEEKDSETKLFVAGCPKNLLSKNLKELQCFDIDPERASLDMELLILASMKSGKIKNGKGSVNLIVSVGLDNTLLGLVVSGEFKSLRTLRYGVDRIIREVEKKTGFQEAAIFQALFKNSEFSSFNKTKASNKKGKPESDIVKDSKESDQVGKSSKPISDELVGVNLEHLIQQSILSFVELVQKELFRFLTGNISGLFPEEIFLTGIGARIPTVINNFEEIFDVPIKKLDLFNKFFESDWRPESEMALAASMGAMGLIQPQINFRQEELKFKKKFDRLKAPISILMFLVIIFLLYTDLNILNGRRIVEESIGVELVNKKKSSRKSKQPPRYTGLLYQIALPDPRRGHVKAYLPNKISDQILRKVSNSTPRKRIKVLLNELKKYKRNLEVKTGFFPELKLESGLSVLVWFSQIIKNAEADPLIGKFLVTSLDLRVGVKISNRYLDVKLIFRGEDFRDQAGAFMKKIQNVINEVSSPFVDFEEKGGGKPFQNSVETGADYTFRLNLKKEIPVSQNLNKKKEG